MLIALSELFEKEILPASKLLNKWANDEKYNLAGAGATLLGAHNQGLMGKIIQYEKSLNILNDGVKNHLPKSQIIKLENNARKIHSEMNNKYNQDISHLYNKVKAKKGTPLNNINRGVN
ncbi:hypothetical protein L4C36_22530, partial [Photobacterium japonica]|uniref:hypothetical protein n=1 Tax=Photobacterium japonica TaxID=2910235 RepID=UPI003D0A32F1